MNTRILNTPLALCLMLISAQAPAIPVLKSVETRFSQPTNNTLSAGMIVSAETDLPVLVLGGGFTIECTTNSLKIEAQRAVPYNSMAGPDESVRIPTVVPFTYTLPGWSSIPVGTCGVQQCRFLWRAEARDESTATVSAPFMGLGVNFRLIPDATAVDGNTVILDLCRLGPGQPQCCTQGCSIP